MAVQSPVQSPLRERVRREMASGMLLAAEEVFAESGLAKAHVEEIARRAGVSVGTLYNYYKDRDALLAAVLTTRNDELTGALKATEESTETVPVRAALLELVRTYLRFVIRRRTFMRILVEGELVQLREAYPQSWDIKERCWLLFHDLFARVMARGVADGVLPSRMVDLDRWLFLGLMRGVVFRDLRGGFPCREADADRVIEIFFDGVGA